MSSSESDFKELGNLEYKKGAYLKAAAIYTRGLKADPSNAVLLRFAVVGKSDLKRSSLFSTYRKFTCCLPV